MLSLSQKRSVVLLRAMLVVVGFVSIGAPRPHLHNHREHRAGSDSYTLTRHLHLYHPHSENEPSGNDWHIHWIVGDVSMAAMPCSDESMACRFVMVSPTHVEGSVHIDPTKGDGWRIDPDRPIFHMAGMNHSSSRNRSNARAEVWTLSQSNHLRC